jgi:uncharacterized protein (TIRG00374 family)
MIKKISLTFLKLLVTAGIFFALFRLVPYSELVDIIKSSDKFLLLAGFILYGIGNVLGALRWRYLLGALDIHISRKEAVYSYFSGLFLNLFFPSFIAGDIFRGASLSNRYGELKKVASSVIMDRFSGMSALIFIACFSLAAGGKVFWQARVLLPMGIITGLSLFVFLIIFSRKFFEFLIAVIKKESIFKRRVLNLHKQLYFLHTHPVVFSKSMLYSFGIQFLAIISFFINARAFGVAPSLVSFLILVPIITTIATIPITIAGAGTREAAAIYFFSLIGLSRSVALGIGILNLFAIVLLGVIGGIIYLTVYNNFPKIKTE